MYQQERMDEIVKILKEKHYVTVNFLVKEIKYSPASIRRDLTILEKQGIVKRSYGGVSLCDANYSPFQFRQHSMKIAKNAMAKKAAELVKDRDVADDILQETLIKAVRVIDEGRYADTGKFLSWVLRIAHNQVIDYFRAQKSSRTVSESDAGYAMLGTLRFAERTVEDKMVSEQIEADVRRLIDFLPEEQREVVMMRYYAGLSFQEIADQTEVSINTALGRMRYALINLRKMIKDNNLILS